MNKKFTVLVGLLMAVVVTGYSVSGTYAKYAETFNGTSATAQVAKWDVKLFDVTDGTEKALTNTFTFDLFKNATNSTLKDGVNPAEIIAPGSKGSFIIKVKNSSDVRATVAVDFTVTNGAGIPLTYKVNDVAVASLDDIDATEITNANGEYTLKVEWEWPYNADSDSDTTYGKASATAANAEGGKRTEVTVKADVTVSQVALGAASESEEAGSENA